MPKLYSKLRAVFDEETATWAIFATYFEDDIGRDGLPTGDVEWQVPEWSDFESEAKALRVIKKYEAGSLPEDLRPIHPHNYT